MIDNSFVVCRANIVKVSYFNLKQLFSLYFQCPIKMFFLPIKPITLIIQKISPTFVRALNVKDDRPGHRQSDNGRSTDC